MENKKSRKKGRMNQSSSFAVMELKISFLMLSSVQPAMIILIA